MGEKMTQWDNPLFQQTALFILSIIFTFALILFPLRKKSPDCLIGWKSVQSWLIGAPIIFILVGAGPPWPIIGLVVCSIFAAKEFYQMTGMYHRNYFVFLTYLSYIVMGYAILNDDKVFFNIIPMIFLALCSQIPVLQNQSKNMIQYIALSLMSCLMFGWGFLHLGWIIKWEDGPYFAIYLILLTEVCDITALVSTRYFGKHRILQNITTKRSLEGVFASIFITLFISWGMKYLLPNSSNIYWMTSALVVALAGSAGILVLSVIRRDLDIRDTGAFIIGRGGILDRMDRIIFVAPIYYHAILFLNG